MLRGECTRTGLIETQVAQGQREADPQRQLDPNQQASLERVTVVPDVELGDQVTQVLLELEPKSRENSSGTCCSHNVNECSAVLQLSCAVLLDLSGVWTRSRSTAAGPTGLTGSFSLPSWGLCSCGGRPITLAGSVGLSSGGSDYQA